MAGNLTREHKRLHGQSKDIYQALLDAGWVEEGDYTKRVTIVIDSEDAVTVTVERWADDRVVGAIRALGYHTRPPVCLPPSPGREQ